MVVESEPQTDGLNVADLGVLSELRHIHAVADGEAGEGLRGGVGHGVSPVGARV